MSDAAIPLFLMFLASQSGGATKKKKAKKKAPKWPTTSSPPPLAAFKARKTKPPKPQPKPSADPGGTSTPLAQLHAAPPSPPPASAIDNAKAAAANAIRQRTTALIKAQTLSLNPFARKAAPATSTALVSQLQKILNSHGVSVVQDGLYGPKTAGAWSALAKRKGLPPTISREGPQIAKVVAQTFQQLSVPPIP